MSKNNPNPPPPLRSQRETCWRFRDEYFNCLTLASIDNPTVVDTDDSVRQAVKAAGCLRKKKEYEEACPASWVAYFNKRRALEISQAPLLTAAARQMDEYKEPPKK
ncbi:hypothetical protein G9A89_022685 [Geosiphon pyriformis]|nr:hypothetical protein G9A89_022685 [Geosiphon pyriformis]